MNISHVERMTIREPFAEIHLLITIDRSFHRQMKNSLYSSLYFEKIGPNVVALLTQTPIIDSNLPEYASTERVSICI